MKLHTTLAAITLAFTLNTAQASTPIVLSGDHGTFGNAFASSSSFNDGYSFELPANFIGAISSIVIAGFDFSIATQTAHINSLKLFDSANVLVATGADNPAFGLTHFIFALGVSDLTSGSYTLMVNGTTPITGGSYAGNFSLTLSPIPETDTWSMALAGLGLIGLLAHGRRQKFQANLH